MSSCTTALETAYAIAKRRRGWPVGASAAADMRRGAPVIAVPDITFVATANAALAVGARPALVDIQDLSRPVMRMNHAAETLDGIHGEKLAITIVHYAGFDSDSDSFAALAAERGLLLIEDAAHAMGGWSRSGRRLGTTGEIGCFSFFSNKNLATGEGGMLVTNDPEIASDARKLRSHGMSSLTHQRHMSGAVGYDVSLPGHNYRCTEITAALGIEQLKKLDRANTSRRRLYKMYRYYLRDVPGVLVPYADSDDDIDRSACHIFALVCRSAVLRDALRARLHNAGIQVSHHYAPIHTFTWYRGALAELCGPLDVPAPENLGSDLPSAEELRRSGHSWPVSLHFSAREITLPLYPSLRETQVEEICGIVKQVAAET
jgi:dTDP-4-amino-4,6-dideoxygalactose transaminase